ncbi:MAG: metal-transporting ATPase, partial [Ruminiclostridium sp.]|nr:metal-transporting ATPase [Ruminiclostridium sp.]
MRKMEYELKGLNCADCAIKIEREIAGLDGIDSAQLIFATQKLKLQIDDTAAIDELGIALKKIVGDLEPAVEVLTADSRRYGEKAIDILRRFKYDLLKLAAGLVLFTCGVLLKPAAGFEPALLMLAYIITGSDVLIRAAGNIIKGRVFDENFLMSIATIGAIAVGQYPEAAAVMLFFKTGTFLQDLAVHNSRKSIKSLLDLRPENANLKTENGIVPTDPALIKPGDIVIIKPGERVPLDSMILEGNSLMDTSALTGEPVPRAVKAGDSVLGGFINMNGLITAQATKTLEQSAVSRILELVQNAAAKKARMENFITRFAVYYTPAVVVSALLTALIPPLATGSMDFDVWIYRALIFLVISCPCALVVSIPLTFFAGIGKA